MRFSSRAELPVLLQPLRDSGQLNHTTPILLVKIPIIVDGKPAKICAAENILKRGVFHSFKTPTLSRTTAGIYCFDVNYVVYLTNT